MMYKTLLAIIFSAIAPTLAQANNIKIDTTLPTVTVANKGELVLNNNTTGYQSWRSTNLEGKTHIIMAIAGRSSAKEINAELVSAISAANFPQAKYQTITIINQDDAIWGTASFVQSATEKSKKKYPWSSMVLDSDGVVQKTWDLKKEDSAIIVINKNAQVVFIHEGKLNQHQIKQVITLVKKNI
ncbi:YtfJ family protein [Photobacterium phosphoreum]|uniref:YtfJ family protein n=1 Tax=Photobacterium phosphoreum TaxID=659 RepID=UPI000D178879|nr:YtfJ family protein [Photobacterium phosphoreum]MCD9508663.1 YtfJ family protein [Photobacterium phosphoreum]MCD9519830.1 YtfJ family protein [Photobacterium phosphoreum]PSU67275.1 YtfJ family protein [Photobacterium phosphoreum]PSW11649.1 YtfJ family protein [Photobacterium phosphoreum]